MSRVFSILAPGLLGGSIGLAVKRRGLGRVVVWARREAAAQEAVALGCADVAAASPEAAVAGADVVVLCCPVEHMGGLARQVAGAVKPGAVVTDVGSVKAGVVGELEPIFSGVGRFVGSHPMAGSEKTGAAAAVADLFMGRTCIVTPTERSDADAVAAVEAFWASLGGVTRRLSPQEHDVVVGLISHLPHVMAAALVNAVAATNAGAFDFFGPGFRDTTRVAAGPAEMWSGILSANRDAVLAALDALTGQVAELRAALAAERQDVVRDFLAKAQTQRERLGGAA